MDRRDLAGEIDPLKSSMTDPFHLEKYDRALGAIKKKLEELNKKRSSLSAELDALAKKGYVVNEVTPALAQPVENLKVALEAFKTKVKELEGLSAQVNDMDHRWLEGEFKELASWLHDPANISKAKQRIKELREIIDKREKERSRVKAEVSSWEKDGYKVSYLKEALEDGQERFIEAHKDAAERVKKAKDLLKKLNALDARFFVQEASDVRAKIMDPLLLDNATASLDSLKQEVEKDRKVRDSFAQWLKDLSKDRWNVQGLDRVLKSAPSELEGAVNEMKRKVGRLNEALSDAERWDQLECNWLTKEMNELKNGLLKVEGSEKYLDLYEQLKDRVAQNRQTRDAIRKQLEKWKDEGYITKNAHEKIDSDIATLTPLYDDLKSRIERLENVQTTFDKLDFKHFRSQAEEIEFKLNDPYLAEELEKEVESLKERIDTDRKKRQAYGERIKGYVSQGFTGAKRLIKVMEEDMAIVDLEFRNFDKEVETFKKLLASTGYVQVQGKGKEQGSPKEKESNELSEALDNLMQELSDKQ
jgi:chromosome segregation ATPase